jgi:hypothetical protein
MKVTIIAIFLTRPGTAASGQSQFLLLIDLLRMVFIYYCQTPATHCPHNLNGIKRSNHHPTEEVAALMRGRGEELGQ